MTEHAYATQLLLKALRHLLQNASACVTLYHNKRTLIIRSEILNISDENLSHLSMTKAYFQFPVNEMQVCLRGRVVKASVPMPSGALDRIHSTAPFLSESDH